MLKKKHIFSLVSLILLLSEAQICNAAAKIEQGIPIWTRKPGNYVDANNPGKSNPKTINPSSFKTQSIENFDIQYEKNKKYQGVYLSSLVEQYSAAPLNDLVLFHFKNKMIIPIELKYAKYNKNIFLASKIQKKDKWSSKFPLMRKKDKVYYYRDPNPTSFSGNKIVVLGKKDQFYYRSKNKKLEKRFSPWAHVDSLVGIEFVNSAAYYRQFDVSDLVLKTKKASVQQGFEVFKDRCQYCHGVRLIGAQFGWDYVDPLKISKMRDKKNLHLFVKYPKVDAFGRGLKMPNQIDLEPEETQSLWVWIDAIGKKKSRPYRP